MVRQRLQTLTVALLLLGAPAAWARSVATVADLEGSAASGDRGALLPLQIGSVVNVGNEVRTGRPGRLRLVLANSSVLAVADDTRLIIDEQAFDPAGELDKTALRVLQGRVRSLVGTSPGGRIPSYEIETASAVVNVHGTEFVVDHDPAAAITDAVCVTGTVAVRGIREHAGRGIVIEPRELTRVVRGQLPSPPRRLDAAAFRQYLEGLEFIGAGRPESIAGGLGVLTANAVAPGTSSDVVLESRQGLPFPQGGKPDEDYLRGDRWGGIGTLLGNQPPAVISKEVELGIRF